MGTQGERLVPIDDLGAVVIVLACLVLIAILACMGKETAAFVGIIQTIIGFLFGKHTRKPRR